MEVLDKMHTDVKRKHIENSKFISFCERGIIYLSKGASIDCELSGIRYMHFVIDKGNLYFYLDDEALSGYCVTRSHKKNMDGGYRMQSQIIVQVLKEKLGVIYPSKFYLLESDKEHNGNSLIQVLLHSPYKTFKKK